MYWFGVDIIPSIITKEQLSSCFSLRRFVMYVKQEMKMTAPYL